MTRRELLAGLTLLPLGNILWAEAGQCGEILKPYHSLACNVTLFYAWSALVGSGGLYAAFTKGPVKVPQALSDLSPGLRCPASDLSSSYIYRTNSDRSRFFLTCSVGMNSGAYYAVCTETSLLLKKGPVALGVSGTPEEVTIDNIFGSNGDHQQEILFRRYGEYNVMEIRIPRREKRPRTPQGWRLPVVLNPSRPLMALIKRYNLYWGCRLTDAELNNIVHTYRVVDPEVIRELRAHVRNGDG